MPSWNIHTAHVERLLREHGASELGIGDKDAFLMGNLLPDVYVGYMVPDATWRIDYKLRPPHHEDHSLRATRSSGTSKSGASRGHGARA